MAAINVQPCLRLRTCGTRWRSFPRNQFPQKRCISSTYSLSKPKDDAPKTVKQNKPVPLMNELQSRGLVSNTTKLKRPYISCRFWPFHSAFALNQAIESGTITAYCGVDPTAESLHLGNLMTLMPMIHLYARGHNIIPLVKKWIAIELSSNLDRGIHMSGWRPFRQNFRTGENVGWISNRQYQQDLRASKKSFWQRKEICKCTRI